MSLLGVIEFSAFLPVLTSSMTPLIGIRLIPCATPLWGGPSGHLADPTLNAVLHETVSIETVMDFDFPDVHYILDILIVSVITLTYELKIWHRIKSVANLEKKERWSVLSPIGSILSKLHTAPVHVFADFVLCLGGSTVSEAPRKFTMSGQTVENAVGLPGRKEKLKSLELHFLHVYSFSSNSDAAFGGDSGECFICKGRCSYSLELALSPKIHRNDDGNFQNASVIRDYAGRLRPGFWFFARPGSGRLGSSTRGTKSNSLGGKLGPQSFTG